MPPRHNLYTVQNDIKPSQTSPQSDFLENLRATHFFCLKQSVDKFFVYNDDFNVCEHCAITYCEGETLTEVKKKHIFFFLPTPAVYHCFFCDSPLLEKTHADTCILCRSLESQDILLTIRKGYLFYQELQTDL